jgi:anti-sigma factor RsiW
VAEILERHDDHDPLSIAALLDRDLVGDERTAAEARLASCPACAALHADLLALSTATRTFPVPPRPRDYTLSAADGARLTAPLPDARATATHASHDTMLVTSLADHSLAEGERAAADALVAACAACADLFTDLEALRVATREMPVPARPRDFTLTADDAVRMRPGGWRRLVAAFGTSRDMLSRPLAAGLTTLGLVGLLFATIPSILPSSAAATAPSGDRAVGGPVLPAASAGAAALAPVAAGAAASPAPSIPGSDAFGAVKGTGASATPGSEAGTAGSAVTQGGAPGQSPSVPGSAADSSLELGSTGPSTLIVLSAAFLIAGLGLFLIRWTARRLGDG